jgi:3-phenylpropionate/trans-cinnamate dioxygenase ferredoxin reductase subunit
LRFDYDSLVIATGTRPVIPNIKGIMVNNTGNYRSSTMVNGLLLLRNYGDGIYMRDWIKRENSKSCVIVGAGLIGIEMV